MGPNRACWVMEGGYWALASVFYGYATYFLRSYGFSAGAIGTLTALSCVLSAILQNMLGSLNDRGGWWNWKRIYRLLLWVVFICLAGMLVLTSKFLIGLLFTVSMIATNGMMPFPVIACFEYQNQGIKVNYGAARATGSLTYAVAVAVIGMLVDRWGRLMVPAVGMAICLLADIFVLPMQVPPRSSDRASGSNTSWRSLRKMYPAFFLMAAGLVFLFSFHCGTNTYLLAILEHVGGDTRSLGIALAISACIEVPVEVGIEKILKHVRTGNLLVLSGFGFLLKSMVYLTATGVPGIYVSQILQICSYALFSGCYPYYVNDRIAPPYRSEGQALLTSSTIVGTVIGNLSLGWVFDQLGLDAMLWVGCGFVLVGTAIVSVSVHQEKVLVARKTSG